MVRKLPFEKEFEVTPEGVLHKPTRARFYPHPGSDMLDNVSFGSLRSVLPNGDVYREDDVTKMAEKLWAKQKK